MTGALASALRAAVAPLPAPDDPAFAEAFDPFADARIVLLGEASHGTGDFYRARAAITRRLIERHGFNIVGPAALREALLDSRLERFIGVIYRPETERWSHYAGAVLARQFDAWAWFDETEAVIPLPGAETGVGEDDLWPFGL